MPDLPSRYTLGEHERGRASLFAGGQVAARRRRSKVVPVTLLALTLAGIGVGVTRCAGSSTPPPPAIVRITEIPSSIPTTAPTAVPTDTESWTVGGVVTFSPGATVTVTASTVPTQPVASDLRSRAAAAAASVIGGQ